jgi:hypothetical protein
MPAPSSSTLRIRPLSPPRQSASGTSSAKSGRLSVASLGEVRAVFETNVSSTGGSLTLNSDPKNPHRSMSDENDLLRLRQVLFVAVAAGDRADRAGPNTVLSRVRPNICAIHQQDGVVGKTKPSATARIRNLCRFPRGLWRHLKLNPVSLGTVSDVASAAPAASGWRAGQRRSCASTPPSGRNDHRRVRRQKRPGAGGWICYAPGAAACSRAST